MAKSKSKANRIASEHVSQHIDQLLAERAWCYVIPPDANVDGHGFRVSIAIEGEQGHRPTGDMRTLSDNKEIVRQAYHEGATAPYFWGKTYEEAQRECQIANDRIGITGAEAARIVMTTIG